MDFRKRYMQKHKDLGLCVYCSRKAIVDKRTLTLTTRCWFHTLYVQKRNQLSYEKNRKKIMKGVKKRQERYRKEGRCRCGRELDKSIDGGKSCPVCKNRGF